jgi:hypothetical protein
MQFKTDENLPLEVAEILVQSGYDAVGVDQQRLAGVKVVSVFDRMTRHEGLRFVSGRASQGGGLQHEGKINW